MFEVRQPGYSKTAKLGRQVVRFLLLAGLILTASPTWADVAGVPTVTDGDTIRIGEARIRLFGIDAPEGKQSCQRDGVAWLCGQEAGGYLRKLLNGEPVTCTARNKDRYGRIVAICKLPDGRDICADMVGEGLALAYRQYGGEIYDKPEADAKASKGGLWAGEFMAPWEWRKKR